MVALANSLAPENSRRVAKNRVWDFFANTPERVGESAPQVVEAHREKTDTRTNVASGLPVWLNRDPIGEAGGLNLYGMVGNNPVNNIDILGMSSFDDYMQQNSSNLYDRDHAPHVIGTRQVPDPDSWGPSDPNDIDSPWVPYEYKTEKIWSEANEWGMVNNDLYDFEQSAAGGNQRLFGATNSWGVQFNQKSTSDNLTYLSKGFDGVFAGLDSAPGIHSTYLFSQGLRLGTNGNYPLRASSLSRLSRVGPTASTLPISGLKNIATRWGPRVSKLSGVASLVSGGIDINRYRNNEMSGTRLSYHLGSSLGAVAVASAFGGPAGFAFGVGTVGGELLYDHVVVPIVVPAAIEGAEWVQGEFKANPPSTWVNRVTGGMTGGLIRY